MGRRFAQAVAFAAASAAIVASLAAQASSAPTSLTVHEWGTFTSVAGAGGQAVRWLPQDGPPDLPCFVERNPLQFKGAISGTVRMETPVLYFYSPDAIDASVDVRFPQGLITEWYPHATMTWAGQTLEAMSGAIAWPSVRVLPGSRDALPRESGPSHYYAARETGASPLRVGEQPEKFLFYRGVGQFQPTLAAVVREDGGADLRSLRGVAIGDVLFFENRRGAMTFSSHHLTSATAQLSRPDLDDVSGAPLAELKRMLAAHGLFEREAQAMVETWKDSWFEEGARLLYIVTRADVDAILPLTIAPKPSSVERVFVGRMELVTPATIRDVSAAIAANDRAVLAKYGRFLQPIAERAGLAAKVAPAPPSAGFVAPPCR
jgi:hypothetical protein